MIFAYFGLRGFEVIISLDFLCIVMIFANVTLKVANFTLKVNLK